MSDFRIEAAARLAAFDLPAADEPRIVEELALHLEARYAELRRDGHDDATARRQVLDEISDDALRQGGWLVLPAPRGRGAGADGARQRPRRRAVAGSALRDAIAAAPTELHDCRRPRARPRHRRHDGGLRHPRCGAVAADALSACRPAVRPGGAEPVQGHPPRHGVLRRRGRLASGARIVRRASRSGNPAMPISPVSAIPNASRSRSLTSGSSASSTSSR